VAAGDKRPIPNIAFKALDRSHRALLRLTGGRVGRSAYGMQVVTLHTVGRRSGRHRSTTLTTPISDGHRLVLVASKGGVPTHPDWYGNLMATPAAEIVVGGITRRIRARTATAGERADLWPTIVKTYDGYARYQSLTDREIPVVICEYLDE
jgi:deazaflavin-dependent oxidoreductase (nitroreductase family)